jgi:hypothetical protein
MRTLSRLLAGSTAPFCTMLPIQSCAPTTTSGPLPAVLAVMKLVCRSAETTWTSTLMPLSAAKSSATARTAFTLRSSVQITRSAAPVELSVVGGGPHRDLGVPPTADRG